MMVNIYRICAFIILAGFYSVYLGKMIAQRKQGIVTDQIAKDKSDSKRYRTELIMKIATYSVVVVEVISIISGHSVLRYSLKTAGLVVGILGDIVFLTAVITMADSWRAGIAAKDHTGFVDKGIFNLSRNPAFLGFDLVYISILFMFFNWFLLVFTAWAMIMLHLQILQEEEYLAGEFGKQYEAYRKRVGRYFGIKKRIYIILFIFGLLGTILSKVADLSNKAMLIPDMSFEECIAYTTQNNPDACITVGIIKDGKTSYKVYGANGEELANELHTYEIGSLTKTMTASCIYIAEQEGKLSLDDTIDKYLDLPDGHSYPTIKALLTHTSGYYDHYLNINMMINGVLDRNPFRYVYGEQILKEAAVKCPPKGEYDWYYSNFGYALLGLVLEDVYNENYLTIVNDFAKSHGMENTSFNRGEGDLHNYWKWELRDSYASAGAVKSDIADMLHYAQLQMESDEFSQMHNPLATITENSESYELLNIQVDEIGMAWIIDDTNGYIWHNGGTDDYNSYLGFCKKTGTAVVVLSNLPTDYRIPATVMGIKLLDEIQ